MAQVPPATSIERIVTLAAVLALHALIFVLVLATQLRAVPPPSKAEGLTVFAAAPLAQAAQLPPPPPTLPSRLADQQPVPAPPAPGLKADSDVVEGPATPCPVIEELQLAILADREAFQSVVAAPPESRSVAEAIVLWNAGWSSFAASPTEPLGPVRATIEQVVGTLDAACLEQEIAGPRLIAIPAGSGNMFLVFGSGFWRWRDTLAGGSIGYPPTAMQASDRPPVETSPLVN